MDMEWTMEKALQLIEMVQVRPTIWNFTPKDYRNRTVIQKRKDAIMEIANYFQTTPKQIEHKLSILRTQYSREKIKMIKSRKTAVNKEDVFESKWFAFKPMSFMMQKKRELRSGDIDDSLMIDNTTNDDSSFNEFKISNVESLANEEKRIKLDSDDNSEQTVKRKFDEANINTDTIDSPILHFSEQDIKQPFINHFERDEFMIFGESISSQLRNLKTNYGRSLAKLNIQKAIFEAETWEEKNCHTNGLRQFRPETKSTDHD